MSLAEADAIVKSLLKETAVPEHRAKLVALQLALGLSHALEVEPDDLLELRSQEVALLQPVVRAQVWLGCASFLSLAWNGIGLLLGCIAMDQHGEAVRLSLTFGASVGHAMLGLMTAWRRPGGLKRAPSWLVGAFGLLGPAFMLSLLALGLTEIPFIALCIAPSLLVALTASGVVRHAPS